MRNSGEDPEQQMAGESGSGLGFRHGGADGAVGRRLQRRQSRQKRGNDDGDEVLEGEAVARYEHGSERRQRIVNGYVADVDLFVWGIERIWHKGLLKSVERYSA